MFFALGGYFEFPENVFAANDTGFIISEYVEGSHNNKVLELYNGSENVINLANYKIDIYANGRTSSSNTIIFSNTMLEPGETFVMVNSNAGSALEGMNNLLSSKLSFNGDDAVALNRSDGSHVDVIGKIGQDPGSAWLGGGCSTKDRTLVKKPLVSKGDSNGSDSFDPSVQWNCYPEDNFSHLGWHLEVSPFPEIGATDVSAGTTITAVFNRDMNASAINGTTFTVTDSNSNSVSGSVAYDSTTRTAICDFHAFFATRIRHRIFCLSFKRYGR